MFKARSRIRKMRKMLFESLEPRTVLAVEHAWTGAVSDNWHTGGNWSTGNVPDDGDTAVFDLAIGSTAKLYADQVKDVTIFAKNGANTLSLNGFDFEFSVIATPGSAHIKVLSRKEL